MAPNRDKTLDQFISVVEKDTHFEKLNYEVSELADFDVFQETMQGIKNNPGYIDEKHNLKIVKLNKLSEIDSS